MKKQLSYVLMLPLQQIALRRLAVILWNEPDILASIGKFQESIESGDYQKKWREAIECEVADKITKLHLPESLTKQLIQILKPVGLQILKWKIFHEIYLHPAEYTFSCEKIDVPILEKLCWTAAGTVDYRKTAEELVSCDVVDIVKRYKLACLYCLDHYIPAFWKELPQENKTHFYNEHDLSHIRHPHLQFCWPYILKGEEHKLDRMPFRLRDETFHQHIFSLLSITGNTTAMKYFFQKMSIEEREASLILEASSALESRFDGFDDLLWKFPKGNGTDIVCYLLSQMTPEQEIQIFKVESSNVLACFLDWPWQGAFLDIADKMWTWIQCDDLELLAMNYDSLLEKMAGSIRYSDYYSPTLYQDFFVRSPSDFRKHFVDQGCGFGTLFWELFTIEDTETINVILRNLDAGDRMQLVSSEDMFNRYIFFLSKAKGNVMEMCLREIGLSKADKESLKKDYMEFLSRKFRGQIELGTPELRRFFEFLDETNAKVHSKRNSDNDAMTESKKFCCEKEENPTK